MMSFLILRKEVKKMAVDLYGRDIVSMWIKGYQLFDLRSMVKEAVKLFDERMLGSRNVTINERFECIASGKVLAKDERKPVDLFTLTLSSREKGYLVSVVEPNPAKARNVQVYVNLWMRDDKGISYYQEVMHFIYHPRVGDKPSELIELRYLPDCSGGKKR
jgi:hypothetical protein